MASTTVPLPQHHYRRAQRNHVPSGLPRSPFSLFWTLFLLFFCFDWGLALPLHHVFVQKARYVSTPGGPASAEKADTDAASPLVVVGEQWGGQVNALPGPVVAPAGVVPVVSAPAPAPISAANKENARAVVRKEMCLEKRWSGNSSVVAGSAGTAVASGHHAVVTSLAGATAASSVTVSTSESPLNQELPDSQTGTGVLGTAVATPRPGKLFTGNKTVANSASSVSRFVPAPASASAIGVSGTAASSLRSAFVAPSPLSDVRWSNSTRGAMAPNSTMAGTTVRASGVAVTTGAVLVSLTSSSLANANVTGFASLDSSSTARLVPGVALATGAASRPTVSATVKNNGTILPPIVPGQTVTVTATPSASSRTSTEASKTVSSSASIASSVSPVPGPSDAPSSTDSPAKSSTSDAAAPAGAPPSQPQGAESVKSNQVSERTKHALKTILPGVALGAGALGLGGLGLLGLFKHWTKSGATGNTMKVLRSFGVGTQGVSPNIFQDFWKYMENVMPAKPKGPWPGWFGIPRAGLIKSVPAQGEVLVRSGKKALNLPGTTLRATEPGRLVAFEDGVIVLCSGPCGSNPAGDRVLQMRKGTQMDLPLQALSEFQDVFFPGPWEMVTAWHGPGQYSLKFPKGVKALVSQTPSGIRPTSLDIGPDYVAPDTAAYNAQNPPPGPMNVDPDWALPEPSLWDMDVGALREQLAGLEAEAAATGWVSIDGLLPAEIRAGLDQFEAQRDAYATGQYDAPVPPATLYNPPEHGFEQLRRPGPGGVQPVPPVSQNPNTPADSVDWGTESYTSDSGEEGDLSSEYSTPSEHEPDDLADMESLDSSYAESGYATNGNSDDSGYSTYGNSDNSGDATDGGSQDWSYPETPDSAHATDGGSGPDYGAMPSSPERPTYSGYEPDSGSVGSSSSGEFWDRSADSVELIDRRNEDDETVVFRLWNTTTDGPEPAPLPPKPITTLADFAYAFQKFMNERKVQEAAAAKEAQRKKEQEAKGKPVENTPPKGPEPANPDKEGDIAETETEASRTNVCQPDWDRDHQSRKVVTSSTPREQLQDVFGGDGHVPFGTYFYCRS